MLDIYFRECGIIQNFANIHFRKYMVAKVNLVVFWEIENDTTKKLFQV